MTYSLEIAPSVLKVLRRLPKKEQLRIALRIEALADNPRPDNVKKMHSSEPLYRIRSGDYRILYRITDHCLRILIVDVGHRREVYRSRS